MHTRALAGLFGFLWLGTAAFAGDAGASRARPVERGTVRFQPVEEPDAIPERYRLREHTFDFDLTLQKELKLSGVEIHHLRYPSPVVTAHPENNTVHAEYYRPKGNGPFPGVVVLDVMAGDQSLSRSVSTHLAQHGVAALFVQMAYYGPRRPPGSGLRLVSPDYRHSMEAVRQTVLDIRCAAAWLEARPEIDGKRLGVIGTSLGSFMAALAAEMEPRFRRVGIVLGGGGLVQAYYDDPRAKPVRVLWEAVGGTREKLIELLAPADPLTYAANLKDRRVLLIAARRDDIVPPAMAEALWKATGQQKIIWYDCTHYGAALHFASAMEHVISHFGAD